MRTPAIVFIASVVLGMGQARAEPGTGPASVLLPPLFVMPDVWLQQGSGGAFGAELFLGKVDDAGVQTLDLSSQLSLSPGLAMFVRVPLARASLGGTSGTTLGNITAGVERVAVTGPSLLGVSLAVALPTAADQGESSFASYMSSLARLDVGPRYFADTTTLSLHGHYRADGPRVFVQALMGLDIWLVDAEFEEQRVDVLRIGAGGGFRIAPELALVMELTTISFLFEPGNAVDDEFYHWLDMGARYALGDVMLGAWLYLPLDHEFRAEEHVIGMGMSATMRLP